MQDEKKMLRRDKMGRQDATQKKKGRPDKDQKNRETRHETKTTGRQEARQKKGR